MYRIGNWINEGFGWIIESIEAQHINISVYSPLSESAYIELSNKLKTSMKGLINIKSICNKCFLWCHIRHLNPLKMHPERITKTDKKLLMILIMKLLNFLSLKEIIAKLNKNNNICINILCYENELIYPVYVSDQKFKNSMDLLLISDKNYVIALCVYQRF